MKNIKGCGLDPWGTPEVASAQLQTSAIVNSIQPSVPYLLKS